MALAWPLMKELSNLRDRFNELVDRVSLGEGAGASEPFSGPFCPSADLYEGEQHVVVIMEVAGADPSSIDIQVQGDRLRVSGRLQRNPVVEGERFLQLERPEGAFFRDFQLPSEVALEEPLATLERGVLTVRLPRAVHALRRRIEVREERS